MPIFVFAILAPTLAFYFYALVQFWAEFRRRRHGEAKVIQLPDVPEQDSGATSTATLRESMVPVTVMRPAISGHPEVVTAFLKSRLAVQSAHPGLPALKRAAKG
jgi:hypothetical protein